MCYANRYGQQVTLQYATHRTAGFIAQRLTNMLSAMTISNGASLQNPSGFPKDPAWSLRTTRRMTTWCEGASPYWTQSAS